MKLIKWGVVLLLAGFGINKLLNVKAFYDTFDFRIKAKLNSIKQGNIIVIASVQIDNPTSTGYKMSKPYIKVFNSSKTVVASSVITPEMYNIQPKSSTLISNIEIRIPVLKFLGLVTGVAPSVYTKITQAIQSGVFPTDFTIGAKFLTQTIFDFDILKDIIIDKEIEI